MKAGVRWNITGQKAFSNLVKKNHAWYCEIGEQIDAFRSEFSDQQKSVLLTKLKWTDFLWNFSRTLYDH